jgi:thiamine-phosphate diphosphorylase
MGPFRTGERSFAPLAARLGLYPVVPDVQHLARMLDWGARTLQLRYKPAVQGLLPLRYQVRAAVAAGREVPGAQVFINDHWQLAMEEGAYGVHLGQEDWAALSAADRAALQSSGLRLGLSTHTLEELALACAVQPSYLAIGPVYPTSLKAMPYEPVGVSQLARWVRLAQPVPVVAIGGIGLEQAGAVWDSGVNGVAIVSAILQAADPQMAVQSFLRKFR